MNCFSSFLYVLVAPLAIICGIAIASPGHDHSHDEAPQAATGPVAPRFEAHSELFEVVGVLGDSELSIFVDRYNDNAPVLKAKVELESGATKAVGQFHEEHGDYSFAAERFKKPGSHPITLTVTSGDDVDILAGNLVVPDAHADGSHHESSLFKQAALWMLGLSVAAALAWTARRLIKRRNAGGLK
jgi:hypothetical protein